MTMTTVASTGSVLMPLRGVITDINRLNRQPTNSHSLQKTAFHPNDTKYARKNALGRPNPSPSHASGVVYIVTVNKSVTSAELDPTGVFSK